MNVDVNKDKTMQNEDLILELLTKVLKGQEGMETQIGTIQEDITELKADVSTLKNDVSELKSDVSVLKEDVSGLKEDVSSLKQDNAKIHLAINELRLSVMRLAEKFDDHESRITRLEKRPPGLNGH